jgi:HlyD family secretion protein
MSSVYDKVTSLMGGLAKRGSLPAVLDERRVNSFWTAGNLMNGVTAGVLVVMIAGAVLSRGGGAPDVASPFITTKAAAGDIVVRVSATGTVEPARIVDVSTELSGMIRAVHVQNNDRVVAGQLLAELDSETLVTQLIRARAAHQAAKARLAEGRANINQADRDVQRKQQLVDRKIVSERDMDLAATAATRAGASADALSAEVSMAQADVDLAEANLKKARIVAPIDGVVLRRSVEPGQAIAASLQSPVLFRIAANLDHMQVRVDIDEADALSVAPGQSAQFTTQALRNRTISGRVEKIHLGPEVVQGVVIYKAVLSFDNSELRLRPGMTVTADVFVSERRNVLLVPNEALRFAPPETPAETGKQDLIGRLAERISVDAAAADPVSTTEIAPKGASERRLFKLVDGRAVPVAVTVGATDGAKTEIVAGDLAAGDRVIVDYAHSAP